MSSAPESCISCRFFLPGKTAATIFAEVGGMCRRYAPTGPAIYPAGAQWQAFPPMSPDEWCGDYRPQSGAIVGRGAMAA